MSKSNTSGTEQQPYRGMDGSARLHQSTQGAVGANRANIQDRSGFGGDAPGTTQGPGSRTMRDLPTVQSLCSTAESNDCGGVISTAR